MTCKVTTSVMSVPRGRSKNAWARLPSDSLVVCGATEVILVRLGVQGGEACLGTCCGMPGSWFSTWLPKGSARRSGASTY